MRLASPPAGSPRRRARFAGVGLAALTLLLACGSPTDRAFQGTTLPTPYSPPAVTLTDTSGQPYDVQAHLRGAAALIFFGYTHCPDVCPTVMADAATALRALPTDVRARTRVVFVSSDPHRDTPAVLRDFLGAFDFGSGTQVAGLTGDYATITSFATAFGIPLEAPVITAGSYEVGHGARLTGVTPAGKAPVSWLPGDGDQLVTQLKHDVPLLLTA